MIKDKILENLYSALKKIGVEEKEISLEHPANPNFGDYATSIALKLAKYLKKNPLQIAKDIVKNLPKDDLVKKVEVIKPGFINFWINTNYFLDYARKITQDIFDFPHYHLGKNKKIMVEFAHPNTHKLFHIGHLRNISSGEALSRILMVVGNTVIRSNYQGDVGLYIAKCLYQVKSEKVKVKSLRTIREKVALLGKMYAEGNKAYETDDQAKKEIIQLNQMIYQQQGDIVPIWKETRQWSLDYFDAIYKRVDAKFDRLYFESELPERGKKIIQEALKKGILEKSEGAIVFKGKPYGLDTRVFLNALSIPTYEGKELALAEKEFSEYGELDKCIHVVGPEQSSFFKVTFKAEELIDTAKYKGKQMHLIGGWVRLKHGKMSSRSGVVVEGPWLLNEAKKRILKDFKCDEDTAEAISVAAVKYSFLKNHISAEIAFDFDESISLEGNSGPYLLYTFVRTQSVLNKSTYHLGTTWINNGIAKLEKEERDLLRTLANYSETVYEAARNFSPNLIANYLYDLAQKYNLFYQKHKILLTEEKIRIFRLLLTKATGQVIKNGLYLLGIKTVNKM